MPLTPGALGASLTLLGLAARRCAPLAPPGAGSTGDCRGAAIWVKPFSLKELLARVDVALRRR